MNQEQRIEYFMSEIARLSNQVVDLQNERDALAALVEALNSLLSTMQERATLYLQPNSESDSSFANFIVGALDGPEQRAAQLSTPQHHLRELRAEAGRDGFLEGCRYACDPDGDEWLSNNYEQGSNQYADSIRQEK